MTDARLREIILKDTGDLSRIARELLRLRSEIADIIAIDTASAMRVAA